MKKVSILSLSLLTVMAGAAVAPALGVIREYFAGSSALAIQMIISMPALFIFLTSFIFPKLTERLPVKSLVMIGLMFYVIGGCLAGMFNQIGLVLAFRALVGVGVGIIMPLSTGLLSFYYPPEELDGLMGLSSAMNQMGGVVATLLSGMLAAVSWRLSFLVYLLGLICAVLCLLFLPNDRLQPEPTEQYKGQGSRDSGEEQERLRSRHPLLRYYVYIIAMFLLMVVFFLYPSNFAIETVKEGVIGQHWIAVIMAFMDLVAFLGGLSFARVKKRTGRHTLLVPPALFLAGYALLALAGGWIGAIAGSAFVGFANGIGVPSIISEASQKAGKSAVSTVMPLLSAAIYLGQFLAPFIMSGMNRLCAELVAAGGADFHLPYLFAAGLAAVLALWVALARR
ncbi:MAG: MFS transporter [Firmicutes bacterium]|nr:MFS transporter [Bacillota bacterium]